MFVAFHECASGQTNAIAPTKGDPMFAGKPLSAWIELGFRKEARGSQANQDAINAVCKLGANAVPLLLQWLAAKDSPTNHIGAAVMNELAKNAFGSLAAIDPNTHAPSFDLRDAAAGVVNIYQQNVSPSSREAACAVLDFLGSAIDPAVKKVIPDLFLDATNTQTIIGIEAIGALGNIRSEAAAVVPFLAKRVNDADGSDPATEMAAIQALGNFGTNARSAIPALIQYQKGQANFWKDMAAETIHKIDPNAAAKP